MIGPSNSLEVAESHPRSEAPSGLHRRGNQRPLSHRQPPAFRRSARHKSAAEAGKEGARHEDATRLGKEAFRTRNRSVRRLSKKLHRIALRKKSEEAAEELKGAYRQLVRITRASLAQAGRVAGALRQRADTRSHRLADKLEHFVPLIERGIDQAVRRVLREEQVPAAEKVLSLFEPHTMIITRRKVGKPREYGRKVLLDEVEGGIISRYEVLKEAGREHPHLPESIEGHRERFGRAPELLAGDRGLYSKEGEEAAKKAGIRRVALPQSGPLTKKRKEYEEQPWFKRAFAFRAGVEGRISVLRRKYALERCLYHGEDVGWDDGWAGGWWCITWPRSPSSRRRGKD